jgi:hypothetical protein
MIWFIRLRLQKSLQLWRSINRAWENIKDNIKTSAKMSLDLHELKQNKLIFDDECLGFLDQRKHAKMQSKHDPSQSTIGILNH